MECVLCGAGYGDYSTNGQSINRTGCCVSCWSAKPDECEQVSATWDDYYSESIDQTVSFCSRCSGLLDEENTHITSDEELICSECLNELEE